MKASINLLMSVLFFFNSLVLKGDIVNVGRDTSARMIEAYTLVYDAMYSQQTKKNKEYLILDMESLPFVETTYEERQKTIEYFEKKYNKPVLNASLFKLKEIGLTDKLENLEINAELLMITSIVPDKETSGIIVKGAYYVSPVSASFYTITMGIENDKWVIKNITLDGVA